MILTKLADSTRNRVERKKANPIRNGKKAGTCNEKGRFFF